MSETPRPDPWEHAKRYQWTSATALIKAGDAARAADAAERDTLRAERDAAQQQIATLTEALKVIDSRYYLADIDSDILRDALKLPRRADAALSTRPQEQPSVQESGFDCAACGHRHQGRRFAYICIGCPCTHNEQSATHQQEQEQP